LVGAQSEYASRSIAIADLAFINGGSCNLVDIASTSLCTAECSITSSLLLINSSGEDGRAVGDRVLTSQDRIAGVVSAGIRIDASDVWMGTTDCGIARVVGADVVVIAFEGNVEGNVDTAANWIAGIVSAGVVVIAVDWSVLAGTSGGVAIVIAAGIPVIAGDGSGVALTIDGVAPDCVARLRAACYVGTGTTL